MPWALPASIIGSSIVGGLFDRGNPSKGTQDRKNWLFNYGLRGLFDPKYKSTFNDPNNIIANAVRQRAGFHRKLGENLLGNLLANPFANPNVGYKPFGFFNPGGRYPAFAAPGQGADLDIPSYPTKREDVLSPDLGGQGGGYNTDLYGQGGSLPPPPDDLGGQGGSLPPPVDLGGQQGGGYLSPDLGGQQGGQDYDKMMATTGGLPPPSPMASAGSSAIGPGGTGGGLPPPPDDPYGGYYPGASPPEDANTRGGMPKYIPPPENPLFGGGLDPRLNNQLSKSAYNSLLGIPDFNTLRGNLSEQLISDVNESSAARGAFGGSVNQNQIIRGLGGLNMSIADLQSMLQSRALGGASDVSGNLYGQASNTYGMNADNYFRNLMTQSNLEDRAYQRQLDPYRFAMQYAQTPGADQYLNWG